MDLPCERRTALLSQQLLGDDDQAGEVSDWRVGGRYWVVDREVRNRLNAREQEVHHGIEVSQWIYQYQDNPLERRRQRRRNDPFSPFGALA